MKNTHCRSCHSHDIEELFNFGKQPLAGFFAKDKKESLNCEKYTLDITICNKCGLLQVTHLPPIESIFHENYNYSSSTIKDLVNHFSEYSKWLNSKIPKNSKILEFGCNDGIFIDKLRTLGHNVYGVDASDNVAEIGRKKGLNIKTGFFNLSIAEENYEKQSFDLITCSNVLAHTDDLYTIFDAVKFLLKNDGIFAIEVHDAKAIFDELHYDFIYHEHLSYFDRTSISNLLSLNEFEITEILETNMHGQGLRVLAKKIKNTNNTFITPKISHYKEKMHDIEDHIKECITYTEKLANQGDLYGYGAAGRSQMFLNFTDTSKYYKAIFDDSPLRQNRYIAGSETKIVPYHNEEGKNCVILAWNYYNSISKKIESNFKSISVMIPKIKSH